MPVKELSIKSAIRNYSVFFSEDFHTHPAALQHDNTVYIVDEKVRNLHKSGLLGFLKDKNIILLPVGEQIKNLSTVESLYRQLCNFPAKKNLTLVSVGGGIIQDISGFLASTLYRGIRWIYLPTTLLAQADSCIGGKTSLNFLENKNLIGTFYPPFEVHIYSDFLHTLEESDYFSGLGEIIKLFLIAGEEGRNEIIRHIPDLVNRSSGQTIMNIITAALQIKKSYIEEDEFDQGRRNILNYGHCLGHAIESSSNFAIPHGQAVVAGMILANIISKNRNYIDPGVEINIFETVLRPVLKIIPENEHLETDILVSGLKKDKKRQGLGLPLITLKQDDIFEKINDLKPEEIEIAVTAFKQRLHG